MSTVDLQGKGDAADEAVLDEFRAAGALLEGHFILSSGKRSATYLQCALVLRDAHRAERLCGRLAKRVQQELATSIDLVVSPAMGGVVVGYEMGRQFERPAIFAERVDGQFCFRRGFDIAPGQKCFMMEDVVTTGLSSRECIAAIEDAGGEVVAAGALVDRSNGHVDLGVAFYPLIRLDVPTYDADQLPDSLNAIEAIKPGSRGLK